jgi:acylglycerol lipase
LNYDCIGPLRTELSGVIASAPLVLASAPTRPNKATIELAGMVSKVLPSFQIPVKLSSHYVSRDKEEVAKYDADPLVHGYGTAKGMYDMLTNGEKLITTRYKEITKTVPVLICHGTEDGLTSYEAAKEFFDKCEIEDKEFKTWPGFYHELHNEPEDDRKEVIAFYIQWIRSHLPGASA